ncbi:WD40 repeat-like protein [Suillus decipiens]|nr:WD40 repeat-like protein [Suillus decipiens]
MPREEAESSTSSRSREVLFGSSARMRPLKTEKDPPSYGAQHCQDAIWEGGNKVLPPLWQSYKLVDGKISYQDDTLSMVSWNRPLPGVRLDALGQLVVVGCEWHISPAGRSYFVNHNSRSTSWKKPTPERPPGSLMPECTIEGHSHCIWSLACLGTSSNLLSASEDCSIWQWKIDGEPVGKPLNCHGAQIGSMAVSPDETMVVSGSTDGRLRLWDIKKGSMVGDPWEGHDDQVKCLDWSPNALEIASGSEDGTIRRWDTDTGRQIAPPIETGHGWVNAVKYSPRSDKFMSCGHDETICVWSKDGQMLIKIKGHDGKVTSLCWSKDGAYIFSASFDHTIRKWRLIDGKELVVLRGHTNAVRSLCLSPNESHIVSASNDYSVLIWDLETNRQVGENSLLHNDELTAVVMSPDGKYIASAGLDAKVYIWSMEAALKQGSTDDANAKLDVKFKRRPIPLRDDFASRPIVSKQSMNNRGVGRYGNDFFGNDMKNASASPVNPLSVFRKLFGTLHVGTRPRNSPRARPREPRHWNPNLFFVGISRRPVEVAPCREEDRYGITPETDAEAAAAMERTDGSETNSSMQPVQPAEEVEESQERPMKIPGSSGGTGEISCEVNCCGFFFGRRRSTSHQP